MVLMACLEHPLQVGIDEEMTQLFSLKCPISINKTERPGMHVSLHL